MRRLARIAIQVLGPPLLTFILYFALNPIEQISAIAYGQWHFNEDMLTLVWLCLIAGWVGCVYTVAMEVLFSRILLPESWSTVAVSAGFGVLAGSCLGGVAYKISGSHAHIGLILIPALAGAVFGFVVGGIVRLLSKTSQNQPATGQRP